jgi:hypothetical protein
MFAMIKELEPRFGRDTASIIESYARKDWKPVLHNVMSELQYFRHLCRDPYAFVGGQYVFVGGEDPYLLYREMLFEIENDKESEPDQTMDDLVLDFQGDDDWHITMVGK